MDIKKINFWLICFLDAVSILSLFGTNELKFQMIWYLVLSVFIVVVLNYRNLSLNKKFQTYSFTGILTGTVILSVLIFLKHKIHPLIISAHLILIVHGLVWFSENNIRTKAVRMFLGMCEISLASVLTPDFYIAFAIFIYFIVGTFVVSGVFLEMEFDRYSKSKEFKSIPVRVLFYSLGVSFLIFFISLFIFPILPRPSAQFGMGWNQNDRAKTGYTEQVNFGILPQWLGSNSSEKTVLRIFLPDSFSENSLNKWFPSLLLRGKPLDVFEYSRWRASESRLVLRKENTSLVQSDRFIEVIREPIQTELLPVPYSTQDLKLNSTRVFKLYSTSQGWVAPESIKYRVQYLVELNSDVKLNDKPTNVHLELPQKWISSSLQWQQLAKEIFHKSKNPSEKISKLYDFFKKRGYIASTENQNEFKKFLKDPKKQLDLFLFGTKRGHCEYFASAGAFLLRMAGVPSRIVSGFRISKPPLGNVLTIKQSDAHAWIEAWDEKTGWIPIDLTPRLKNITNNQFEFILAMRDYFSAYWYRYVLAFDPVEKVTESKEWFKATWKGLEPSEYTAFKNILSYTLTFFCFIALSFILILIFPFLRSFYIKEKSAIWSLFWRLKLLKFYLRFRKPKQPLALAEWLAAYEYLRFGPIFPKTAEWSFYLKRLDDLLKKSF